MLNRPALLSDLQKLLKKLEADLLERSESAEVPEVGDQLRREFEEAKQPSGRRRTFRTGGAMRSPRWRRPGCSPVSSFGSWKTTG